MSARALAAPLHRHIREDEYSYVLEGRVGALLGNEVVTGSPGDPIFKPRNQWHTFWNAKHRHHTAARWGAVNRLLR
jgi:quercetin dioxygenase-like cupin family protein